MPVETSLNHQKPVNSADTYTHSPAFIAVRVYIYTGMQQVAINR